MTKRVEGGVFGTFLETARDLESRVPAENQHQRLDHAVENLPDEEVRRRFVSLLEAVDPDADCCCSDLSQVTEDEAVRCGYHTSRIGWIVHQARQLNPLEDQ